MDSPLESSPSKSLITMLPSGNSSPSLLVRGGRVSSSCRISSGFSENANFKVHKPNSADKAASLELMPDTEGHISDKITEKPIPCIDPHQLDP